VRLGLNEIQPKKAWRKTGKIRDYFVRVRRFDMDPTNVENHHAPSRAQSMWVFWEADRILRAFDQAVKANL